MRYVMVEVVMVAAVMMAVFRVVWLDTLRFVLVALPTMVRLPPMVVETVALPMVTPPVAPFVPMITVVVPAPFAIMTVLEVPLPRYVVCATVDEPTIMVPLPELLPTVSVPF